MRTAYKPCHISFSNDIWTTVWSLEGDALPATCYSLCLCRRPCFATVPATLVIVLLTPAMNVFCRDVGHRLCLWCRHTHRMLPASGCSLRGSPYICHDLRPSKEDVGAQATNCKPFLGLYSGIYAWKPCLWRSYICATASLHEIR